jgi:hypothetical protein
VDWELVAGRYANIQQNIYIPSARDCSKMLGSPPAGRNEFRTAVYAKQLAFSKGILLSVRGQGGIVEMLSKNRMG